ncbi:YMGG-like glycine zipper-containing protein [Acidithiobacillus caldus]|uniref:YMGG-like glycine zipper-containing protein n=3 Tax=Acidithiobacillus TaxID=119977 RepID=UPI003908A5CF
MLLFKLSQQAGGYTMSSFAKSRGLERPQSSTLRISFNGRKACFFALCLTALTGCANMTPTQQSALSGGAIGAAGGAVMGAVVGGSPAVGAAVGGAAGAAAGALLSQNRQ